MRITKTYNIVRRALGVVTESWYYLRSIGKKTVEDDILFLASGLAFNGILTMIPLLLLSAAALGTFLSSSAEAVGRMNHLLDALFPPEPFSLNIKSSVLSVISDIVTYRTSLGLFGVAVLMFTATSLFDALRRVLHRVYRLERTRGLLVSIVHDFGFVTLVFVLFVISNIVVWLVSFLEGLAKEFSPLGELDTSWFDQTFPRAVVFLLTAIMFYIVYRFIPDTKPPKAAGIISTLTTTILWVISGRVFAFYLAHVSAIGRIYGPYAFILVLLFWVYYSSLIFVLGAMVGQVYWERVKMKEARPHQRWWWGQSSDPPVHNKK